MPAALSMDLRWRIVKKSVMYEMVASSIADQLDVPLVTVRKVLRRWRETGSVETHQGRRLKDPANTIMTHEQCMRLLELVTLLDDEVMLDEIHMHFCVYAGLELSVATICRAMHKLGFTRKRLHRLALATSGGPRAARTSGREAKCARTSGRKVKRRVPSEPPGADGEQQQQASSKKKKRRSAKSVAEEDAARANLPAAAAGRRSCLSGAHHGVIGSDWCQVWLIPPAPRLTCHEQPPSPRVLRAAVAAYLCVGRPHSSRHQPRSHTPHTLTTHQV